jgi:hypothetical protein
VRIAKFWGLLLLLPIALATGEQSVSDPIGDQFAQFDAKVRYVSAPLPCEDPSTDIAGVTITSDGTDLVVSLRIASGFGAIRCSGVPVPTVSSRSRLWGLGITGDPGLQGALWADDLRTYAEIDTDVDVVYVGGTHDPGDLIGWKIPLIGTLGGNSSWDLHGVHIGEVAGYTVSEFTTPAAKVFEVRDSLPATAVSLNV